MPLITQACTLRWISVADPLLPLVSVTPALLRSRYFARASSNMPAAPDSACAQCSRFRALAPSSTDTPLSLEEGSLPASATSVIIARYEYGSHK